ncbi:uncharacterized protein [Henckelia pumila]|uniref:uncharacterized protein n=1 Tax=Henckelia pumila TaxID=405737 RepID=UPI003C6DC171
MDSSIRSTNYAIEEDKLLCHVYLDVSQNPIIGINQSKDRFWSRIEEAYNVGKSERMQERNKRSMQCRMQVILRAVRKLCGCVSIIEKLNPSGTSEEDILNRAKDLMMQDKNFTKGFKFDHVWPILKEMEKFSAEDSAPKVKSLKVLRRSPPSCIAVLTIPNNASTHPLILLPPSSAEHLDATILLACSRRELPPQPP